MSSYSEMKHRHQQEFNALPLHFAFGDEQIKRKMAELGLTEENIADRIVTFPNTGGFALKEDYPHIVEVSERHARELKEAIAADKDGTGFIFEMFRYELANHEYGYTMSDSQTLAALGYKRSDIDANVALSYGLELAKKAILGEEDEKW